MNEYSKVLFKKGISLRKLLISMFNTVHSELKSATGRYIFVIVLKFIVIHVVCLLYILEQHVYLTT